MRGKNVPDSFIPELQLAHQAACKQTLLFFLLQNFAILYFLLSWGDFATHCYCCKIILKITFQHNTRWVFFVFKLVKTFYNNDLWILRVHFKIKKRGPHSGKPITTDFLHTKSFSSNPRNPSNLAILGTTEAWIQFTQHFIGLYSMKKSY